ncbi:ABC transporter ATP-binding protein [Aliidiomarina taiwanensis]|uniref:ABC transporter ATP-binding protein n=1 Tax=Aliidiomarina taiwanensis TaxID=946228 RepID=A0A432X193_9GAMM|nr:ATP-binding cassette domain-containing protein [Aliidiomarina taiwanensis]RUO39881.1 ABC transporter ATP-binding protein [Aliidiomarina taiwanensis]
MLSMRNVTIYSRGADPEAPLLRIPALTVQAGEVVTLMGPSGVGKSTLLRWLLGEPLPNFHISGQVCLHDVDLTCLPIGQRQLGMMFQQGGLFPHLTVAENCMFAQGARSQQPRLQQQQQALTQLRALGLGDKWHAYPESLSGGQYARIALLCTLLAEPQAMLLDEPFSALDAALRQEVRSWTFTQLEEKHMPTLLVTHDKADARGRILTVNGHREVVDA